MFLHWREHSQSKNSWVTALLTALLSAVIAIAFITVSAYADDSVPQLAPNTEGNPYELAYGESVNLIAKPDYKKTAHMVLLW